MMKARGEVPGREWRRAPGAQRAQSNWLETNERINVELRDDEAFFASNGVMFAISSFPQRDQRETTSVEV
jgi:hypothetical protein